jgi:hypothetical protein
MAQGRIVVRRVDASSEQQRTQLRKYRLAIEPIARRYVGFRTFWPGVP